MPRQWQGKLAKLQPQAEVEAEAEQQTETVGAALAVRSQQTT